MCGGAQLNLHSVCIGLCLNHYTQRDTQNKAALCGRGKRDPVFAGIKPFTHLIEWLLHLLHKTVAVNVYKYDTIQHSIKCQILKITSNLDQLRLKVLYIRQFMFDKIMS